MAKSLEMEDRFLVSFQPVKDPSDPLGFERPDTGRTTVWLTSIDQIEANDTMPDLIAKSLATPYDPNTKYALYVLDKGPNYKVDGSPRVTTNRSSLLPRRVAVVSVVLYVRRMVC